MAKKSKRRRKVLRQAREALSFNPVTHTPETMSDSSYGRTESYLRSSCLDNAFGIPEEFESWQPYFWSRGAMLREWSRWLGAKLAGHVAKVETDMTPHHTLERKIKERRERNGHSGAGFTTQLASISGGRAHWDRSQYGSNPVKPVAKPVVHREPVIERPYGMCGECHFVL